jgi:hypothetical protein
MDLMNSPLYVYRKGCTIRNNEVEKAKLPILLCCKRFHKIWPQFKNDKSEPLDT